MFENLFTRGAILKRYRTAPLLEERRRYLMHCAQAASDGTCCARLRLIRSIWSTFSICG